MMRNNLLRSYLFPLILIASILLGGIAGYFGGASVRWLKPWGEIFLNLIFTSIVPLIFFNVSSAIARVGSIGKLGRIFSSMTLVFIFTSMLAAGLAIFVVTIFPPAKGVVLTIGMAKKLTSHGFLDQIVGIFTVSDFSKLLSHEHMLALIIFSILVGLAASSTGNKDNQFITFLQSGEQVFMRVFSLIMLYAPFGFFAYFAVLVSELGYVRKML